MTTRLLVAAVAATATFAACGAEKAATPTTPTSQSDARKAMLEYARCMREHGIDMPDPQFEGGRVMQRGPRKLDESKLRAAEQACASIRAKIEPPDLSDDQKQELKQQALAHATCMREHGVDFPDPTFDENGGAQVRIGRGSGIDPESPKFKAAEQACRAEMPSVGTTRNGQG